ncbi:hypothetical protein [Methanoculleus chikugoensis]|nr:hypothetical protein [Methanoculleus chikugoensis]
MNATYYSSEKQPGRGGVSRPVPGYPGDRREGVRPLPYLPRGPPALLGG